MARGFLSGIVWGAATSVVGAAALSIAVGSPNNPDADIEGPAAARAPVSDAGIAQQSGEDADLVLDGTAPQVDSPDVDNVAAATAAGADTPTVPQTGDADALADPAGEGQGASVTTNLDAPVQPLVQSDAPTAPVIEVELSLSTDPAQPAAPAVPDTTGALAPEAPPLPEAVETPNPEAPAPAVSEVAPAPDAPAAATAPAEPAVPAPAPLVDPAVDIAAVQPEEDAGRPTIGRPATSLVDRDTPDAAADIANEDVAVDPDVPPFVAYAAPFENAGDKPLMSIVLMDKGADLTGGAVGVAALQSFPYPLTFAVDATLADAGMRMSEYRAQGFEVAAMIDMPAGATAADAEVSLSAALAAVPEAVVVLEGAGTGLQESREVSDQVTSALLATGHGLVFQSKGLNTAQKLAAREGVPAGVVFRDFDSADQTPTVIRRFLDQAAFRAGQEGGVIMMGRVRPDTISALLLWGLQDRAERVALAPVSAVLRQQSDLE